MTCGNGVLVGKMAVVSGGGGAIGSATAGVLVRDGAHVLISGRTEAKLQQVVERLEPLANEAGGSISCRVANGLDEDAVRVLVEEAAAGTGHIDIAVNVVGGGGIISPALRNTVQMIEATIRQNVTSAYLLLKHACGDMVRSGRGGSFVAVSTTAAAQSTPFMSAYCAAKAALEMLCMTAAEELGDHHVRINLVRPGLIANAAAGNPSANDAAQEAFYGQQPLRRAGDPEDIAEAIRYFAGPESEWTTGTTLTVDGGTSLRRFPDLAFYWRDRIGDEMDKAVRGIVD